MNKQKWIRLFSHDDRSNLEMNLNGFISKYPGSEIRVWNTSDGWWNAQVMYSYPEGPTYSTPENEEESSNLEASQD